MSTPFFEKIKKIFFEKVLDKPPVLWYSIVRKREVTKMKNNMVIEFKDNGEKRALNGLYTYDEACEVQEAMEWLHDENSYLIYTAEEWIMECENS